MGVDLPKNEDERLEKLYSYQILDTVDEKAYDELTNLAASICGVKMAMISLIDSDRQWLKSACSLDGTLEMRETSRDIAFCAHTILNPDEILEVEDARKDDRFKDNIYVKEGGIVFYAGAPLVTEEGLTLGSFCVIDDQPNRLSEKQRNFLQTMADQVVKLFELHKSEIQLEKEKKQFQRFAENSPNIVYRFSKNGGENYHNNQTLTILGYFPELFSERPSLWTDLIHPNDLESVHKAVEKAASGESINMIYRMKAKSGEWKWIHDRSTYIFNAQNNLWVEGVAEDITERKKFKDELKLIKKTLEDAGEMAKLGAWKINLENNELYWSDVTKQIHSVDLNYQPTIDAAINFYKEGAHREQIKKCIYDAIENGKSFDVELKIVTNSGDEKWIRTKGEAVYENDKDYEIIGIFQDIHQEKTQQLQLENSKNQLESIFNEIESVIFSLAYPSQNLLFITPSVDKVYEYKQEEWVENRRLWKECIYPEDRSIIQKMKKLLKQKGSYELEYRILTPTGKIKWIRNKSKIITDKQGNKIRIDGIVSDVTKRKQAQSELKKALELTNQHNERLKNFAHIVSHNLRSHASNIESLTHLLIDEYPDFAKVELVTMLKQASTNLLESIQHLSDVAQMNVNKTSLQPIDLNDVIENAIQNVSALALTNKVTIYNETNFSKPALGVLAYLESIVFNFLTNAIKYRSTDRKSFVKLSSEETNDNLILNVSDNGLGIDLDRYQDRLFGMYNTFHKHPESEGIGLFITKNQVEAIGGKIEVESAIDKGTTFKVYFKKASD
ncbi:MAG: PAS domain-containing protein [Bacteroidota bacterium]